MTLKWAVRELPSRQDRVFLRLSVLMFGLCFWSKDAKETAASLKRILNMEGDWQLDLRHRNRCQGCGGWVCDPERIGPEAVCTCA